MRIAILGAGAWGTALAIGAARHGRCRVVLWARDASQAALLQAAVLYEQLIGLDRLLPIDPRPGTVPPSAA